MTKYKDLSQEDKLIADYLSMRWVKMLWFTIFIGMGTWMLISPEKPAHRSFEKVTVSLLKDLWGIPLGIIFLIFGLLGVAYFLKPIITLKDYTWIRLKTGFYLYFKKRRVAGLASVYNGSDLLVFHPEKQIVLTLTNYKTSPYDEFIKAKPTEAFNNEDIYWSADSSGYSLIYKGKSLTNSTSEYRGDDLYVKSPTEFITLRFKNYKNLKDGVIRKAERV